MGVHYREVLLYINDITMASKMLKFILYADDTTLSTTLKLNNTNTINSNEINDELKSINLWLDVNKLSLNISKSKYMVFHQPGKK